MDIFRNLNALPAMLQEGKQGLIGIISLCVELYY
jgi:hypothetical protein